MTLQMPPQRQFGWEIKPNSSSYFSCEFNRCGQLVAVLNHSLVRGCTAGMFE